MKEAVAPRAVAHIDAIPVVRPFVAPEELERESGVALLRLGANESAFGPAPSALEAMRAAAAQASWYGDPESFELRTELARRHGCLPRNIVVGAGIDDLMGLAVRAYAAGGGLAVATLGTYPTFAYHVAGYGATPAGAPYDSAGRLPLAQLAQIAREQNAPLVYVANPDNPSGSLCDPAELAEFARNLPPATVLLLDEAYAEFAAGADLPAIELSPNLVRLRTFSKAYGLAGARIGYAIAHASVCETFDKIRLQFGVNRLAQAGALAALHDETFTRGVVAETLRGRLEYHSLGERLGLPTLPSHSNFVLFDIGTAPRATAMLNQLQRRGAFVRKPLTPPLDRYVRVTVGAPRERERFAALLGDALGALA